MFGKLPTWLDVNGKEYSIRFDFRDIINILVAFADPNLEDSEKVYICLYILFVDFDEMPQEDYAAAYDAAISFIDNDIDQNQASSPRLMDWEQDEKILIPAVNKVAGYDIREKEQIHWWTFLGWYMSIDDSLYTQVLSIRRKRLRGQKLEKHEQEFYRENKTLCKLKVKLTAEEQEKRDRLNALLG